jgi:hypothetical protein
MGHYHYRADLLRLHEKRSEQRSRCEHDEIHPAADDMYEAERQDCYKQGTWPTVQSKGVRKGRSLAK